MADRVMNDWYQAKPLPDLLLPVPLHKKRLQGRGFNQALEIARPVANSLRLPLDINGIKRNKDTAAQSSLKAADRKKNMAGAFSVISDYSGMRIAVIDDVVTTGSTINVICKVLKASGAKSIDVWAIARRG